MGTPRSNIGTPLIVNLGNGVNAINAQNPFIIPGISPVPTSIVYTDYPRFGDGQPISAETLIMPGGQPFIASPSVLLNGSSSLPNLNVYANQQSPGGRQGIADFITLGAGNSQGGGNENYQKYRSAKEENDRLNELEYSHYNKYFLCFYFLEFTQTGNSNEEDATS